MTTLEHNLRTLKNWKVGDNCHITTDGETVGFGTVTGFALNNFDEVVLVINVIQRLGKAPSTLHLHPENCVHTPNKV